jgi:uncharacterized protein (TIGR03435 family)
MARSSRALARLMFLCVIGAMHCLVHAQAAPAGLRFDVATVRLNQADGCRGRCGFTASHGTFTAENAPLLRIISRAFGESQCYDIKAKTSDGVPERDLMLMAQALLKERFHLVGRLEPENRSIFALVIDKGGAKLRPYGEKVSGPQSAVPSSVDDGGILFMVRHMPDLCERLGIVTGRPVVDKTGLRGDYMIALTYRLISSTNSDSSDAATDIFSAVRDQLGLRLESQRGKVKVLKIEGVDKIPTAN